MLDGNHDGQLFSMIILGIGSWFAELVGVSKTDRWRSIIGFLYICVPSSSPKKMP